MKEIDKVAWLYIRDRRLLCARSQGKAVFYIPGGKRENGESDAEALVREIREELSVDLAPGTIRYVGTFRAQAHGKPEGVLVKIACYTAEFTGNLLPDAEIEEIRFLDCSDKDRCSPAAVAIFEWLQSHDMID